MSRSRSIERHSRESLKNVTKKKKYYSSTSTSRSRSAEHRSRKSNTKIKNKKKQGQGQIPVQAQRDILQEEVTQKQGKVSLRKGQINSPGQNRGQLRDNHQGH